MSSWRCAWIAAWAAALVACAPPSFVVPALPAEVTHVAAIFVDAQGTELAASTIAPIEGERFRPTLDEPLGGWAEAWVFGFSDADLVQDGAPEEEILRTKRLSFQPIAQPLPAIRFVGRQRHDLDPAVQETTPPQAVTADFRPACPELLPDPAGASVWASCSDYPCQPLISQQECSLSIDLEGCRLGTLEGKLDAQGNLSTESLPHLGRCSMSPPQRGGAFRISCQEPPDVDCGLEFFPAPAPPSATVERMRLPLVRNSSFAASLSRPPQGVISELWVEPDRAVAIGLPEGYGNGRQCASRDPSTLIFVDLESMQPTSTATIPPCTLHLAPDSSGGYVGLSGGRSGRLFRLDHAGRLRESVPVPGISSFVPSKVILPPGAARGMAVLLAIGGSGFEDGAALWFSLEPLAVLRFRPTPTVESLDASLVSGHLVRVLDDGLDRILDFDVDVGAFTATVSLRPNPLSWRRHAGRVLALSGERQTLVTNGSPDSGVLMVSNPRVDLYPSFERPMEAGALLDDPVHQLAWVAVHLPATQESGLVRFRYRAAAPLVEPGILKVGPGTIGDLAWDASGRLWASLSEAGELARISLSP